MHRCFAVASLMVLALGATALARAIAPPAITQRLAVADIVVMGRVNGVEDMDIEAVLVPGATKQMARVAQVTVTEILQGPKDLKDIRVAFPAKPAGAVKSYPTVDLQTGREYLLLLRKDKDGKFYICQTLSDALERAAGNANFDKELTQVKRCLKLLADPAAALKSKDNEERLLTASLLIQKYRLNNTGMDKQEPIDAELSKQILTVLKDTEDWGKFDQLTRTTPQILFQQLGLQKDDGWTPPQPVTGDYQKTYTTAARAWLAENAGKYRIKRFVPTESK
jgi:hypothetical protein